MPLTCGSSRSASARSSERREPRASIRSHLLRPMTMARPSRSVRSAMVRSCFSNGIVASSSTTTTSANFTARMASAAASFSSLSSMRARLRRPAVSKIFRLRPRHSASSPMASRVMPGSGPVSSRSSPRRLIQQRGLAGIGAADHGDAQRLGFVEFGPVLVVAEDSRRGSSASVRSSARPRAARPPGRRRDRPCPRRARPRSPPERRGRDRKPRRRRPRRPAPRPCWPPG